MIAIGIIAILAAVGVASFMKAREISQRNTCQSNLCQIDHAKYLWALQNNKAGDAVATQADVAPYLRNYPGCPAGGSYTIGTVVTLASCSIAEHNQ